MLHMNIVRFAHNWYSGKMELWNNGFWNNVMMRLKKESQDTSLH